jgi:hypothetical protein
LFFLNYGLKEDPANMKKKLFKMIESNVASYICATGKDMSNILNAERVFEKHHERIRIEI